MNESLSKELRIKFLKPYPWTVECSDFVRFYEFICAYIGCVHLHTVLNVSPDGLIGNGCRKRCVCFFCRKNMSNMYSNAHTHSLTQPAIHACIINTYSVQQNLYMCVCSEYADELIKEWVVSLWGSLVRCLSF